MNERARYQQAFYDNIMDQLQDKKKLMKKKRETEEKIRNGQEKLIKHKDVYKQIVETELEQKERKLKEEDEKKKKKLIEISKKREEEI